MSGVAPLWQVYEMPPEWYARNWTATTRLAPMIAKWVAVGRLLPVMGTGVRFAYPDGIVVHLIELLPCLDGWEPESLRAGRVLSNLGSDEGNPNAWRDGPAWSALYQQAQTRQKQLGAARNLNDEKQRSVADRRALGRRIYVDGMSGSDLRRAYAEAGEMVSQSTAERDLRFILG